MLSHLICKKWWCITSINFFLSRRLQYFLFNVIKVYCEIWGTWREVPWTETRCSVTITCEQPCNLPFEPMVSNLPVFLPAHCLHFPSRSKATQKKTLCQLLWHEIPGFALSFTSQACVSIHYHFRFVSLLNFGSREHVLRSSSLLPRDEDPTFSLFCRFPFFGRGRDVYFHFSFGVHLGNF